MPCVNADSESCWALSMPWIQSNKVLAILTIESKEEGISLQHLLAVGRDNT